MNEPKIETFLGMSLANAEQEISEGKKRIGLRIKHQNKPVDFPTHVFPPLLRDMIKAYCDCYGSEAAHYGLSMLTVAGACIGNSVWIKERGGRQPAILFSAIVDLPGRGKTPIIETFLKPLYRIESSYRERHGKELRDYQAAIAGGDDHKSPPAGKELVMNNFTVESLHKVLFNNPRGAIVSRDELAGWIRGMDAYKAKGSEEQFWLEVHNGGMFKINRKSDLRPMYIRNAFCSVLGGTQPGVIAEFGQGSKGLNGFLARVLFAYPDVMKSSPYNYSTPSSNYAKAWDCIVRVLMGLPMPHEAPTDEFDDWTVEPIEVGLEPKAQAVYVEYFNHITEQEEACEDDEKRRTMVTKHKSHTLRLALILHWLEYAAKVQANNPEWEYEWDQEPGAEEIAAMNVPLETMKKAVELDRYFMHTSLKVVGALGSPVDQLKDNVKTWYEELPEMVGRKAAVEMGKTAGIGDRTVARYLNNEKGLLFKRVAKGQYEKNYQ